MSTASRAGASALNAELSPPARTGAASAGSANDDAPGWSPGAESAQPPEGADA